MKTAYYLAFLDTVAEYTKQFMLDTQTAIALTLCAPFAGPGEV